MYIQQFFFHLWDEKVLNMEIINKVEGQILERHENEFLNQWDPLTLNQKKTLKLVVLNDGKDMFYADAPQKVGLKWIPSLQGTGQPSEEGYSIKKWQILSPGRHV